MPTFRQRQILSLISGCMIHTVFGAMYTLGTITPYIASHIYYKTDKNIKVVDVSMNYPVMMITQIFGLILSMYILLNFLGYISSQGFNWKFFAFWAYGGLPLLFLFPLLWIPFGHIQSFMVDSLASLLELPICLLSKILTPIFLIEKECVLECVWWDMESDPLSTIRYFYI